MGYEQRCTARYVNEVSPGKAKLESQSLTFHGTFKLVIAFADVTDVKVEGSDLLLTVPGGLASFDLGPVAARWAERIRSPRSRLDRMGIPAGVRVCLLDVPDPTIEAELLQRCGALYQAVPREPVDVILLGISQRSELSRVGRMRWYLRRDGALWLIRPLGTQSVTEGEVMAAGRAARFVDTRVVSFAPGLSGLRFVFPKALR